MRVDTLAAIVLFCLLGAAIISPAHSVRVLYRALGLKENCSNVVNNANLIVIPPNCGPGERLDMMNKCRKVFT